MGLKSKIGTRSKKYSVTLDEDSVSRFARAVAYPSDQSVPPTYPTRFRSGEFELFDQLQVPLWRVLHGEQEYEYESELKVGQTLEYETVFADYHEKKGSKESLHFLTFETQVRNSGAKSMILVARSTMIIRGALA